MARLDDTELLALLQDLESDRVERKEALSDPDKVREALCAYANDLPGHGRPGIVFVGARDDGSCAGLQITDELLLRLSQMRDEGIILPQPAMVVQKRTLGGCDLAVVQVMPSAAPPVRLRGRVRVRVGPRRGTASPDEERILSEKRRGRDLPFDIQPVRGATLDDLDLGLFEREYVRQAVAPEVLEQNQRSLHDQLRSVRMVTGAGDPTVLGILVLGKDPQGFLGGASVQFVRFDGLELTDPIRDQKAVDGPLPELLRVLDEVLEAHISTRSDVTAGPIEVKMPDYPVVALQQLARNAILHRNYEGTHAPVRIYWFDDRIEIQSPGGPFGRVNRENFGQPGVTDYRNLHLAEAMAVLGFVQRFGVGIPIARSQMQKNGNPPPEFEVEPHGVVARVRKRP
jgi:ATP-dependent DNA helicase RecG